MSEQYDSKLDDTESGFNELAIAPRLTLTVAIEEF